MPPAQPESPIERAVKPIWGSLKGFTANTVGALTGAFDALGSLASGKGHRQPTFDVQAEWTRPYSTGSPQKKPTEPDEDEEFSDFNFWKAPMPSVAILDSKDTPPPAPEFADYSYWKAPMPTLEQLDARK